MVAPTPRTLHPASENVSLIAIDNDLAFPEYADDVKPIHIIETASITEGPAMTFPNNPCCQLWIERLCELLESLCPVRLNRFKKELSAMFPKLPEQCPQAFIGGSPASTDISSGRATPESASSPQPSTSTQTAKSVYNIPSTSPSSHAMQAERTLYQYTTNPELYLSNDSSDDDQGSEALPFTQSVAEEVQTLHSGGFDISSFDPTLYAEFFDAPLSLPREEASSLSGVIATEISSQGVTQTQNLPSLGFEPQLGEPEEQTQEASTSTQEEFEQSSGIPARKKARRSSQ